MPILEPPAAGSQSRRLSREARRRQLIAAAMPLAARQGLASLSLDNLAARAGVTRNLLYHYFPRGREDVALAVVEEAEHQLAPTRPTVNADLAPTAGAESADDIQMALLDHALAPTHAWRIHRLAAGTTDPELRATVARIATERVQALSRGHLGPDDPRPIAQAALRGYLGFAEAALEHGRTMGLARNQLTRLLDQMLRATLEAAAG